MGRPRSDPINAPLVLRAVQDHFELRDFDLQEDDVSNAPACHQLIARIRAALPPKSHVPCVSQVLDEICEEYFRRLSRKTFGRLRIARSAPDAILFSLNDADAKEDQGLVIVLKMKEDLGMNNEYDDWIRPLESYSKRKSIEDELLGDEQFGVYECQQSSWRRRPAFEWTRLEQENQEETFQWECHLPSSNCLRPVLLQLAGHLLKRTTIESVEFEQVPPIVICAVIEIFDDFAVRETAYSIHGTQSRNLTSLRIRLDNSVIAKTFLTLPAFSSLQELVISGSNCLVEIDRQVFRALPQLSKFLTGRHQTTLTTADLNFLLRDFARLRRDLLEVETMLVQTTTESETCEKLLEGLRFNPRRLFQNRCRKIFNGAHGLKEERRQGMLAKSAFLALLPLDHREEDVFALARNPQELKRLVEMTL